FPTYLCPDNSNSTIAARFASILGVTAADQTAMAANGCSSIPTIQTGTFNRDASFLESSVISFPSQTQGNLFNGNEASLRLDFNPSEHNRFFTSFNYFRSNDNFGPFNGSFSSARGFVSPQKAFDPNFQISFIHTFNPTILNEFR